MFDDSRDHFDEQQRQEERHLLLDHLFDLWELSKIAGKQESVLLIAAKCGMLTELKQYIEVMQ